MPETKWLRDTRQRWLSRGWGVLLWSLLLTVAWEHVPLPAQVPRRGPITATHLGGCLHDGDVTGDEQRTPSDALLAFKHFLGLEALSDCQRDRANVFDPQNTDITPADALCIFQDFLNIPSCLNNGAPLAAAANTSADTFINTGDLVTLDGVGSTDPDGDALRYRWAFMAVPMGSTVTDAALTAPTAMVTNFTPDVLGTYALTLTVEDGRGGRAQASVTIEARPPAVQAPEPCSCSGMQGDVVMLRVRVSDAGGRGVRDQPVTFTRLVGDGTFEALQPGPMRLRSQPVPDRGALPIAAQTMEPDETVTVRTDSEGIATARFILGDEPLQVVAAQAQALPNDPVIFRITNGTEPVNVATGGTRSYTANVGTNNVSVFDATTPAADPIAIIDLRLIRTDFGAGSVLGVAVNAVANRLYVYAAVATGVQGGSVVLLVVDTETNTLVEPIDPDNDGFPGLLLAPPLTALSPGQILGLDFGHLMAVDVERRRVYAVVPGEVSLDETATPVATANGSLIVLEDSGTALTIVQRVPVGQVPTGVAVNGLTNRIYVTNRGFVVDDTERDSVTVIAGDDLTVRATIAVGHAPLGVQVDTASNLIYVANLFGETPSDPQLCCGSVSVISGATDTVLHTAFTGGITDLAVLVGAQHMNLLAPALDRIYLSDGTILECDVTALTAPDPCQQRTDLNSVSGKLAINDSQRQLFSARRFDNAVAVLDLVTHTITGTTRTGVSVGGLAVDLLDGALYVSDFLGDVLFAVDLGGRFTTIDLSALQMGFGAPGQVEVDQASGRIYLISANSSGGAGGIPPLLALDRSTRSLAAALEPNEWIYGSPQMLGLDTTRNLLYISTTSNTLVILDGTRLSGATPVSAARLDAIALGQQDGSELAQAVAVDVERNLIYVTRCALTTAGCDQTRNALVVLRGPELDPATRAPVQAAAVVASIANIGVQFGAGRRDMALDAQRHLLYVAGAFDAVFGVVEAGNAMGFGSTALTVLDTLQIVDAQGQVRPEPAMAVLGILPTKIALDPNGAPILPLTGDYSVRELAFDATEGLLYAVVSSSAPFTEGFIAVFNSELVIDAGRQFRREPHPSIPGALSALTSTLLTGIDPGFLVVDPPRQRVVVTNQSAGALSILPSLSVQ